jgi:hypothetical protein
MDIQTSSPAVTGVGSVSAVSWAAILAGAAVASAVSLLLFVLAAGLDLASFSLATLRRGSATLTVMAAITLIGTQWIASGAGGYITGRLRTRWTGTHTHEVFFRDTAHGFITWAVATLFIAVGLGSAVSSLIGADLRGGATLAAASTAAPASPVPRATLLVVQSPVPPAEAAPADSGDGLRLVLPQQQPRPYGTQLVLAQDPSERADAPSAPGMRDPERRDAALGSLLTALSMLIGAFIAGVAAAIGGRLRDEHP